MIKPNLTLGQAEEAIGEERDRLEVTFEVGHPIGEAWKRTRASIYEWAKREPAYYEGEKIRNGFNTGDSNDFDAFYCKAGLTRISMDSYSIFEDIVFSDTTRELFVNMVEYGSAFCSAGPITVLYIRGTHGFMVVGTQPLPLPPLPNLDGTELRINCGVVRNIGFNHFCRSDEVMVNWSMLPDGRGQTILLRASDDPLPEIEDEW